MLHVGYLMQLVIQGGRWVWTNSLAPSITV